MKVLFIHHSSFYVELEKTALLFDYFDGSRINGYTFSGKIPPLPADKEVYCFASHKHQDHFDMDILKLAKIHPKVHYVLSKDCKMSRNFLLKHGFGEAVMRQITYVAPEKEYKVGDLKVRTLRSTDAGVAFDVSAEGIQIYHAGDLNWWHWEGAGDLVNGKMQKDFKREMRRLSDAHFRFAFVPLDPRMGRDAFKGFDYFMKNVSADHVFPMHMWQDYSLIRSYKARTDNDYFLSRIVDITGENESFSFEKP